MIYLFDDKKKNELYHTYKIDMHTRLVIQFYI